MEVDWHEHFRLTIPLNDPIVLGILQDLWCNFEIKSSGAVVDHSALSTYAGEMDDWECQLANRFYELKKEMVRKQEPDDSLGFINRFTMNSPHHQPRRN